MRTIGAADEFWRLRLTRLDTNDGLDFEWRDDILYRRPPEASIDEDELWRIEAVRIDDYSSIVAIESFRQRDEAEAFFDRASEDLAELSKTQFEECYLTPTKESGASVEDDASQDASAF